MTHESYLDLACLGDPRKSLDNRSRRLGCFMILCMELGQISHPINPGFRLLFEVKDDIYSRQYFDGFASQCRRLVTPLADGFDRSLR